MQQPTVTIRQLLSGFFRRNRALTGAAVAIILFNNFLNVLLPLSIGLFYDVVLQDHSTKGQMLHWLPVRVQTAQGFFGFFLTLVLLKTVLTYGEKLLSGIIGERFAKELRERSFAAQLRHRWDAFRQKPVSKYLLRYSGDLTAAQALVTKGLLGFSGDAFFLLCAFVLLFRMQATLAATVLGLFALMMALSYGLSRWLRPAAEARRNQRSKSLDFVSTRLHAFYTVKSFNRENREGSRYRRHSADLYERSVRYFRRAALLQALNPLFFFGTMAAVLFVVYRWLMDGGIGKSEVLVFVLLLLYIRGVMRRLLEINVVWQTGRLSMGKLAGLLNLPAEPLPPSAIAQSEEAGAGSQLMRESGTGLRWENIAFGYETAKPLFSAFSGELHPNTINQLRGRGKSTWLQLLQKLHEPGAGSIRIDGLDYSVLTPFEVRRRVAVVSDEALLLGNTVFKAISFRPDPDKRDRAARILKRLRLSFGETDDATLDFPLEPGGRNLSAGEITLLQLARALLTGKPLLLLDDPFRHLDGPRRRRLARLLNRLKAKHTILLAAETPPRQLEVDQIIDLQPETVDADQDNTETQHEE